MIHTTFLKPLNILYLGVGIPFVALALFFTHKGAGAKEGRGNSS